MAATVFLPDLSLHLLTSGASLLRKPARFGDLGRALESAFTRWRVSVLENRFVQSVLIHFAGERSNADTAAFCGQTNVAAQIV